MEDKNNEIIDCEDCKDALPCGYPCATCNGLGVFILEILEDDKGNPEGVTAQIPPNNYNDRECDDSTGCI